MTTSRSPRSTSPPGSTTCGERPDDERELLRLVLLRQIDHAAGRIRATLDHVRVPAMKLKSVLIPIRGCPRKPGHRRHHDRSEDPGDADDPGRPRVPPSAAGHARHRHGMCDHRDLHAGARAVAGAGRAADHPADLRRDARQGGRPRRRQHRRRAGRRRGAADRPRVRLARRPHRRSAPAWGSGCTPSTTPTGPRS